MLKCATYFFLLLLPFHLAAFPGESGAHAPFTPVLESLSEKDKKKLDEGGVVFVSESAKTKDGEDAGIGWAIGIINAPPESVWDVLVDYTAYPEYMPRVSRVEAYEIEGEDGYFGLEFTLRVMLRSLHYQIKQRNDRENLTISWEKDPAREDDFSKNDGQWALREHGENQTLVFYTIDVVTTRRIPQALQNFLLKRDLPNVVAALRDRVMSENE